MTKIMHQNLAVILLQFNYGKNSFKVLVPGAWIFACCSDIAWCLQSGNFIVLYICCTGSYTGGSKVVVADTRVSISRWVKWFPLLVISIWECSRINMTSEYPFLPWACHVECTLWSQWCYFKIQRSSCAPSCALNAKEIVTFTCGWIDRLCWSVYFNIVCLWISVSAV